MRYRSSEVGFTLVEVLVAMGVFSIVSLSFYGVLFASVRSTNASEDVVRVSEEARGGLNRMIRETREGQLFSSLAADSYNVRIDFDGDGVYENPNENGDYENLNFEYRESDRTIRLNNSLLVAGVTRIGSTPIFSYTSNDLRYDWNGDGVTTAAELDLAPARGYPEVSAGDTALYSNVEFAFQVQSGDRTTQFRSQAQLRNRR
ncbi:MAG: prepilin-type N-terminal cleavage/methylation domain-containing protein [Actinobacteria bacterium]|nr:prepilin-type N-terminal cleavage/methylation domain-containing protein [Actinomycetota bacterium]